MSLICHIICTSSYDRFNAFAVHGFVLAEKREVSPVLNLKSDVTDTTEKRATPKVQLMDNISKVVETVPKIETESSSNDKKGSHMTIKEFCERVSQIFFTNFSSF
jgi:hypothetical protein